MHASPLTWVTRVLWVLLPVTLGAALDGALSGSGSGAGPHGTTGAVILAWAVWAVGLFASFVQLPVALTVLRIVVPLPLVAGVIATICLLSSLLSIRVALRIEPQQALGG